MPARVWLAEGGLGLLALAGLCAAAPGGAERPAAVLKVTGKTQPAPGRLAAICPSVVEPVCEVLVRPGDRVKKGQPLLRHDDDEARARVRARQAALESLQAVLGQIEKRPLEQERAAAREELEKARLALRVRTRYLKGQTELWERGATAENSYRNARLAFEKAQSDERAARANLAVLLQQPVNWKIAEAKAKVVEARAELDEAREALNDYTVTAHIDGVVASLTARPGLSARPGAAVWGEIVDLSELDVRCDVTPREARALKVGQAARVHDDSGPGPALQGHITMVGMLADARTGRLPVLVRVANADGRLFCHVPVTVEFGAAVQAGSRGGLAPGYTSLKR